MRRALALLTVSMPLIAFVLSPAASQAVEWPQFRGIGGLGTVQAKSLPVEWDENSNIVWKEKLLGPGGSSPLLFKDAIYLTCYTGFNVPGESGREEDLQRHLVRLDRKTGKQKWATPHKARLPEQDNIRDDHGYATSTPAIDNDHIYVFYGKSGVHAYDHNGKHVWEADVGDRLNGWGSATSPILHKDLVIVNASIESDSLYALDRKTGKEKWKAKGIKEAWNTPLLVKAPGGKTELVVAIFRKILAFDPDTGKELWSCDTGIDWYMVPGLVANEGVVYCIGGRSGGALAIKAGGKGDVTESHRVWTGKKGSNVSSPIITNGLLFWANDAQGIACCAETRSGKLLYEERLPRAGQVYASAAAGDGKIYYTNRTGKTYVVAAKPEFEILATNDLNDRSLFHASPVLDDGRLYLRSNKFLYCIGSK